MKIIKLSFVLFVLSTSTLTVSAQISRELKYLSKVKVKGNNVLPYAKPAQLPPATRENISALAQRANAALNAQKIMIPSTRYIDKASIAALLAEQHINIPARQVTEDVITDLMQYYDKIDPFKVGQMDYTYLQKQLGTPQDWLTIIEPWVLAHKRWPSQTIQEEKQMYYGAQQSMYYYPNDPASMQMKELQKTYKGLAASPKPPQEWLEIIEPWVLEHKRWPLSTVEEERPIYQAAWWILKSAPDSPVGIRLKELQAQYKQPVTEPKTPQEWLEIIELWVLEHKRWPSQHMKGERPLYSGAYRAMLNHPNDPASIRLKELKETYQ